MLDKVLDFWPHIWYNITVFFVEIYTNKKVNKGVTYGRY